MVLCEIFWGFEFLIYVFLLFITFFQIYGYLTFLILLHDIENEETESNI